MAAEEGTHRSIHIYYPSLISIATVPAHAHPQISLTGVTFLRRFFTAAVWCVPALRVPLVFILNINHLYTLPLKTTFAKEEITYAPEIISYAPDYLPPSAPP